LLYPNADLFLHRDPKSVILIKNVLLAADHVFINGGDRVRRKIDPDESGWRHLRRLPQKSKYYAVFNLRSAALSLPRLRRTA
jgi:hypothetical protein